MGGLAWKHGEKPYKCMRKWGPHKWHFVPTDVMTAWAGDMDIALKPGKHTTFLKAFRTAPGWTDDELAVFKACLEEFGFKVTRVPSLDVKKRKRTKRASVD